MTDAPLTEKTFEGIREKSLSELEKISDRKELEDWHVKWLGRKGRATLIFRRIGELPKEDRPRFGQRTNEIKQKLEEAFQKHEKYLRERELEESVKAGALDVTLPGRPVPGGGLHPSTRVLRRICQIWADMGFQVYRSKDVESDEYNFQLLNIPPHHPARDMQDTFYTTDENVVLRTHTSPGQIHAMRQYCPEPIRVVLPGMCYRYEQITARSEIQFTQVEGLAVGYNIRFTDLKGTLTDFARRIFGADLKTRFRASYFPFTEPSAEMDVECILCKGDGCRICKYTGWLEILGCGMVHPVVLQNGGYDPAIYSGYAFGMGPERILMLMNGIEDIRYFWGNDLRFLKQF
jgi:phenylalanyl-tRNA synthetase alpha chain